MRIHILGDDSVGDQARTYAEYRLFAALSQALDTRLVRSASLALRRANTGRHPGGVICSVTIELHDGQMMRLKGSGDHPYAAINGVVERLRVKARPVPLESRPFHVDDCIS